MSDCLHAIKFDCLIVCMRACLLVSFVLPGEDGHAGGDKRVARDLQIELVALAVAPEPVELFGRHHAGGVEPVPHAAAEHLRRRVHLLVGRHARMPLRGVRGRAHLRAEHAGLQWRERVRQSRRGARGESRVHAEGDDVRLLAEGDDVRLLADADPVAEHGDLHRIVHSVSFPQTHRLSGSRLHV